MSRGKYFAIAFILIGYALGTLALTLYLAQHRPTASSLALLSGTTPLPDMRAISDIPTRKDTFLSTLNPIVQQKNLQLERLREELQQWQAQLPESELSQKQQVKLKRLEKRYRLADNAQQPVSARIAALLKRVDTIPASLVLAQAATESGWGTSRFAREANNLFGQWCYKKGCGLVPRHRSRGARHEVRKFAALEQAIDAYFLNLNTHQAYRELRTTRQSLRQQNKAVSGQQLAEHLGSYSSRGQEYVEEVKALIAYNRLEQYEQ